MCAKQCRDANGFKCHCTGEAHLRQMEIFGHNQGRFISGYSEAGAYTRSLFSST